MILRCKLDNLLLFAHRPPRAAALVQQELSALLLNKLKVGVACVAGLVLLVAGTLLAAHGGLAAPSQPGALFPYLAGQPDGRTAHAEDKQSVDGSEQAGITPRLRHDSGRLQSLFRRWRG